MQERPDEQAVRFHRDPIRIIPVQAVAAGDHEVVPFGRGQHPARAHGPVVHPSSVGALVESLDRARVGRPHPVQRRVGILDPLPVQARRRQRAPQQRRLDHLASTGELARSQRRHHSEGGQVGRPDARPRRAREHRTRPVSAAHEPFARVQLGQRPRAPADELHRRASATLLVEQQTGSRRDQPVEVRPITVERVIAVPADAANDQPRVLNRGSGHDRADRVGFDARGGVHDHVGRTQQRRQRVLARAGFEVDLDTAFPPVPHPQAGLSGRGLVAATFDAHHVGTIVRQHHRGHRARHPVRDIHDADPVQHTSHLLGEPPRGHGSALHSSHYGPGAQGPSFGATIISGRDWR